MLLGTLQIKVFKDQQLLKKYVSITNVNFFELNSRDKYLINIKLFGFFVATISTAGCYFLFSDKKKSCTKFYFWTNNIVINHMYSNKKKKIK